MLTIDLDAELEASLQAMARREHRSLSDVVNRLIRSQLQHTPRLVTDIVQELPEFPCFARHDALELQQAWRDEWH